MHSPLLYFECMGAISVLARVISANFSERESCLMAYSRRRAEPLSGHGSR